MKMLVTFLLVALLAFAAADQSPITLNYHETIGIPEAQRIRQAEQAKDFDGSRVAGGSVISNGQYPYLAGLIISLPFGRTSVCSASAISNTRLLTAAHCWWDGRNRGLQVTAVLGSVTLFSGGTRVTSTNVQMHGSYSTINLKNDITIIVIPWVAYNDRIQPISLPSLALQNLSFAGYTGSLVGYGMTRVADSITSNQVARRVDANVIRNSVCAMSYGPKVVDSTICTSGVGNVGPCGGDSGGPLTVFVGGQRIQVGVVSFYSTMGCNVGFPGGYTRVTSFLRWIQARL